MTPIKSMSSKYIKILMQKLFKTEVGISINFVNICGTKDRPKHRHKNSNRFPFYWNLTDFSEFFANGAANMGLLSLYWILTLLAVVFLWKRRDPPVSKWTYGVYLFDFLKMMTRRFPPSFLTTENRVLIKINGKEMSPFSNMSWTSWSTNLVSCYDIADSAPQII